LVRYLGDFVIGTINLKSMVAIKKALALFLSERGLTLSEASTKIKK
jgi:hypothetical protein